jgi:hypothetical protein
MSWGLFFVISARLPVPGVRFEIQIKTFRPRRGFDEPVDGLGDVGYLLSGSHQTGLWSKSGIGFVEDAGRTVEEILAGNEFRDHVVRVNV